MISSLYQNIGSTYAMATDGRRGMLPTGLGIGAIVWQGGQVNAGVGRSGQMHPSVQIPRDCALSVHPVRSTEVARLETRPKSPRTDQQR